MPYCENCGSEINPNAKFCGNCGAARNQTAPPKLTKPSAPTQPAQPKRERLSYYSPPTTPTSFAPTPIQAPAYTAPPMTQAPIAQVPPSTQPQPVTPPVGGESTVGVILFRKPKSLGRWDTFTGVLTSQRVIFAQLTSEMLKVAVQQSRDQAKAQGKGFFGQWSEQLKATWGYSQRYLMLPPQTILAETPGNFGLYNNTVSEVKVKLKGDDERNMRYLEVEFHSTVGKFEFHMDENCDFTDLLKRVYGDRVKMPFGHFSKSINIKF